MAGLCEITLMRKEISLSMSPEATNQIAQGKSQFKVRITKLYTNIELQDSTLILENLL